MLSSFVTALVSYFLAIFILLAYEESIIDKPSYGRKATCTEIIFIAITTVIFYFSINSLYI